MLKLEIHIRTENINISGALVSHYTFVFCAFVYVDDILCHDIYFLILADTFNMYFKDTHSQTRSKRNRITLFTMCKFFLVMNISEYY
jgi:hypothetical protein